MATQRSVLRLRLEVDDLGEGMVVKGNNPFICAALEQLSAESNCIFKTFYANKRANIQSTLIHQPILAVIGIHPSRTCTRTQGVE